MDSSISDIFIVILLNTSHTRLQQECDGSFIAIHPKIQLFASKEKYA